MSAAIGLPVHEHDCDACTFIGTRELIHPRTDRDGSLITLADIYRSCDSSHWPYIVRYGEMGEYATTDDLSFYVRPVQYEDLPEALARTRQFSSQTR